MCTVTTVPLTKLPTRVLDVDASGSSSGLRLVNNRPGRRGYYATLSHVWGKKQIIRSTTDNVSQHEKSIPMSALSQTFRDAVEIARSLGVRYLWIDSLCIIQDDPQDWLSEACNMGSYYLNSMVTIAAVSAVGGHEGCFMPYEPKNTIPCPISIKFAPDDTGSKLGALHGFVRPGTGWDPVQKTDGFHRPILWQRAWVLQERLLSPRLLLFSEVGMSWLCRACEASERVPEGTSKFMDLKFGDKILQSAILGLKKFSHDRVGHMEEGRSRMDDANIVATDQETTDLYNAWYDLVMLYGKCGLTVKSDIFPAIAGIAKAMGNATSDEYYAGHWKSDLHRGLLWTAPDSTRKLWELRQYRAPSWSWASLPATCSFWVRQMIQSDPDPSCLEVLEAEIRRNSADLFGAIVEGRLIVKGILKKAHPCVTDAESDELFIELKKSDPRASLFDLDAHVVVGHYFPDNESNRFFSEVFCAPIMTEASYRKKRGPDGEESPMREARGWAMICLSYEQQVYMRVGLAWVKDMEWFDDCSKSTFTVV